jgi:hypothetical protein
MIVPLVGTTAVAAFTWRSAALQEVGRAARSQTANAFQLTPVRWERRRGRGETRERG